ncbi:MAG: CRISPR-associated protein Csm7 [Magnetococcales bacterium]|nr:CRISPR-associated protein Csm7 [Magnetococcales bacterium]
MHTLLLTIEPLTAFVTPLHGDTMFGQLCWALRNRHGDDWLRERLQGYTENRPFLVVSDAFPAEYWPRPCLPPEFAFGQQGPENQESRKEVKARVWLPNRMWKRPLREWMDQCQTEKELWNGCARKVHPQPHNSINRLTGTTGSGDDGFAPYVVDQIWFPPESELELWLVVDPQRLDHETLQQALEDVGRIGFGKDASTGQGHFRVESLTETPLPRQKHSNAWLTLGHCAPQGGGFDPERSFYLPFTRFGRHGDTLALTENPFKKPMLLARTGAVLTPAAGSFLDVAFVGRGLGGDGSLSTVMWETVHQGYAPVVGIHVAAEE